MSDLFLADVGASAAHAGSRNTRLRSLARLGGATPEEYRDPPALLAVGGRPEGPRVSVASHEQFWAVGEVRLDNRGEVERVSAREPPHAAPTTDLERVTRAFASVGEECFGRLSGAFGFVLWDRSSETLYVVRDWLGLSRVFIRETSSGIAVSSHAEVLRADDRLDETYVAGYLLSGFAPASAPGRTVWESVRSLLPGELLTYRGGSSSRRTFASLWNVAPSEESPPEEAEERFRVLFDEAVRVQLESSHGVWAEVSGGLDSSSIVVTARHLFESGGSNVRLSGAYTLVDDLDREDQRQYFGPVVESCDLDHFELHNFRPWQQDEEPPPHTDEPWYHYIFWASDRASRRLVAESGADVVLGGYGADQLLGSSRRRIADCIRAGRLKEAVRTSYEAARHTRTSFWSYLWKGGVQPLIMAGKPVRRSAPDWLRPEFAARVSEMKFDVPPELEGVQAIVGFRGHYVRQALYTLRRAMEIQPVTEYVEHRHPFLYGPLLEFVLSIPPHVDLDRGLPKGLLRRAMGERLPRVVRRRLTNDSSSRAIIWALTNERAALDKMLESPVLAEYGIVEPDEVRGLVAAARAGMPTNWGELLPLLSLETWLTVRAGRWPVSRPSGDSTIRRRSRTALA